jgi:threonine/homoserine/homoserine lactone efflux protein
MLDLFDNTVLGLSLAAPIGPVNSEAIRRGVAQGFWGALSIRLGAAAANICCLSLAYVGLASVSSIPWVRLFIWIVGSVLLLFMGAKSIKAGLKEVDLSKNLSNPGANSLALGFFLAVANPFAFVWWFSVFGATTGADGGVGMSFAEYLNSMTMLIGILLWSFFLAASLALSKRFMTEKGIKIISVLAGSCLIWFGLKYGYQGILELLSITGIQ